MVELCQIYRVLSTGEKPCDVPDVETQTFGEIIGEFHHLAEGDWVKKTDAGEIEFVFRTEAAVPMEVLCLVEEEEVTQLDSGRAGEEFGPMVEIEERHMKQNKPTGLQILPTPAVLSAEEVRLHERTRLRSRSWCEHCVSCKSRMDN